MRGRSPGPAGLAAAGALAALTVFVFARLQDAGPVSALLRFHEAALRQDVEALADVSDPGPEYPSVRRLVGLLQDMKSAGATVEFRRVIRGPRNAEVWTIYRLPSGQSAVVRWSLHKAGYRFWRVDAVRTWEYIERPFR